MRPPPAPRADVPAAVVVGAGPVGQSVALLLARWGVRVRLLDAQERRERVGSRSICQHRDVLDIWEAVGAGRRVAAEGVTWTTARTFYRDRELSRVELGRGGFSPFPPFVNVSQSRTEEILDACLAAEPLIDVHRGHEVTGIEQDPHGVTVHCRTAGGERAVRAPYAVACAGAHGGGVREHLGVAFEGDSFDDRFLICDIRARLEGWRSERRFWFDPAWNPGRQVLIHPCPDGVYRIDWQVPPDFDLAAEAAGGGLDARIRAIVGDIPYEVVWRSVYRFSSRVVDRMRVGRVLLAGDLAHVMAPFGARGLNSGVADAENAAWKVAFCLRGWAGPGLLESYQVERRAAALENLDVTSATMRFLVPRTALDRQRRSETLERALHDASARSRVDSGRLSEPFWYADSPLTTPDPSRPRPRRPPVGAAPAPAPGVLVPDVPLHRGRPGRERLRAVVRDGLLALTAAGVDARPAADVLAAATPAPSQALAMERLSPGGAVADALGARPGEIWLVRPDGHVAAVLGAGEPGALATAARRALGHTVPAATGAVAAADHARPAR